MLWKHMKILCPDKEDKSPKVLKLDDQIVTEPASIVDRLNCYFTSVTERYLPNSIHELDQDSVNTICSFVNSKVPKHVKFSLPPITTNFVLKQLTSMRGLDGFSINILKMSGPAIIASITKLCNLSLETGEFPDNWKEAKVTPLFKGGEKDQCSNYRPIWVLPILPKILEKHVYTCLYEFFQKHKLLVKSQFGFRKYHSCQTALISFAENMYEAINVEKVLLVWFN